MNSAVASTTRAAAPPSHWSSARVMLPVGRRVPVESDDARSTSVGSEGSRCGVSSALCTLASSMESLSPASSSFFCARSTALNATKSSLAAISEVDE